MSKQCWLFAFIHLQTMQLGLRNRERRARLFPAPPAPWPHSLQFPGSSWDPPPKIKLFPPWRWARCKNRLSDAPLNSRTTRGAQGRGAGLPLPSQRVPQSRALCAGSTPKAPGVSSPQQVAGALPGCPRTDLLLLLDPTASTRCNQLPCSSCGSAPRSPLPREAVAAATHPARGRRCFWTHPAESPLSKPSVVLLTSARLGTQGGQR